MSAYVVDDETINRIVSLIYRKIEGPDYSEYKRLLGPLVAGPEWWRTLGAQMFALNVEAVRQCYPDCRMLSPGQMPGKVDHDEYQFRWESETDLIALKALNCWRYQCSEGDVPKSPLYVTMSELRVSLMEDIISALPSYAAAAWR